MPPLEHSTSFTANLDPGQVRERVLGWFASYTHRVTSETAEQLVVASGSQAKMRLVGGAFIAGSSLPTKTVVMMQPSGAGTEVSVTAQDAVGIGLKTGMKGKYDTWLQEIVAGLQGTLT
jgi:carbon monoxide dehydrogenase subunit G